MGSDRLSAVQGLRGVAALLVVLDHAIALIVANPGMATGPFLPRLGDLTYFGASGVDLFFVISGFVMAHMLGRGHPLRTRDFLLARAIRILPMFWMMSALYIAARWWLDGIAYPIEAWANTLTLVPLADRAFYHAPPLYVGWTLGFELCFYGLAAILIAVRSRQPVTGLFLLSIAAAILGTVAPFGRAALAFMLNPIFLEFAMGVAVWASWKRGLGRRLADVLGCVGLLLMVLFLCVDAVPGFSVHYGSVISGESSLLRAIEWGLPYALIMAGVCGGGGSTGLASQALARVGDASFSLYLVHPLVMLVIAAAYPAGSPLDPHLLVGLLCLVALLAALALHHCVERPMLGWLRSRLVRRPAGYSAGSQSPSGVVHQRCELDCVGPSSVLIVADTLRHARSP